MDYIKNQVLVDLRSSGKRKENPWRPKKIKSIMVANSYRRLGEIKKANNIYYCGSALGFAVDANGNKKLHSADFCRERLCPMCQWRRSLRIYHDVSQVMDVVQVDHPEYRALFLTLTIRNTSSSDLSAAIDVLFDGWHKLVNLRGIKRIIKGYFRALEVTYNRLDNTYHPHIHAIILVDKSYFSKRNKEYMNTCDWVSLWRECCNLDYDPICDIRKVYNNDRRAIAEVAKYTLKDADYVFDDDGLMDSVIATFDRCLKGRRLISFGGVLRLIARDLGADDLDNGDLVHIDDTIRSDIATMIEVYRWHFGMSQYILDSRELVKDEREDK